MSADRLAKVFLHREARALRTRLDRMVPFSVSMTMVPAAAISSTAMSAIEAHLRQGRQLLRSAIDRFVGWLQSRAGQTASAAEAQRRFMILRLRFHSNIAQFDIFADVLVQRSEHGNGVWIAGLTTWPRTRDGANHPFDFRRWFVISIAASARAIRRTPIAGRQPSGSRGQSARERMIGQGIASWSRSGPPGNVAPGTAAAIAPGTATETKAVTGNATAWYLDGGVRDHRRLLGGGQARVARPWD